MVAAEVRELTSAKLLTGCGCEMLPPRRQAGVRAVPGQPLLLRAGESAEAPAGV